MKKSKRITLRDLTFNDLRSKTLFNEKFKFRKVSNHINFYQNWFINECARNGLAKIPYGWKDGVLFVSCRRTYVINDSHSFLKDKHKHNPGHTKDK